MAFVETTIYERDLRLIQLGTAAASCIVDPLALDDLAPLAEVLVDLHCWFEHQQPRLGG